MANPPYSASVIIIIETGDGFQATITHWSDTIDEAAGMSVPPSPPGLEQMMKGADPKPTSTKRRNFATRAALITGFTNHVNANPPNGFGESP